MIERHGAEREAVIARLYARLGDRFTEDDIAHAVHAAFDDLTAHAKFQAFLPVLAEKSACERLAEGDRRVTVTVELRGAADAWRDDLEALIPGRWRVVTHDGEIVVVTPDDRWSCDDIVLVADPELICAHLDAIVRRASPHS